jgi:hypothetical protein
MIDMRARLEYEAIAKFDEDGWWVGTVEGIAGVHSQAKSLEQLGPRLEEALAAAGVVGHVKVKPKLPTGIRSSVERAKESRKRAEEVAAAARQELLAAATALTGRIGMSVRDAGNLLEISYQRVHQIVSASAAKKAAMKSTANRKARAAARRR